MPSGKETLMPRWQRAYVIATSAIIGAAFAYAACDWGQWPKLIYLPVTGEFTMSPPPGAITIVYWGVLAWGVGGAVTGALVGAVLVRLFPKSWPERALQLFGAWAITAVLLTGLYYTWSLWPW
jgi:hypothetical protein